MPALPAGPAVLTRRIRAIADPARLQSLIPAVITASKKTLELSLKLDMNQFCAYSFS